MTETSDHPFAQIDAVGMGRALGGIGLNLLVKDCDRSVDFLSGVLGLTTIRRSRDFCVLAFDGQVFQLHRDGTYHENPLLNLLPEACPRGAGAELRLYGPGREGLDPDALVQTLKTAGLEDHLFKLPDNRPHGLREVYILDPDGYCWVISRPLTDDEVV